LFESQIDVLKEDFTNIGKMLEVEKVPVPNKPLFFISKSCDIAGPSYFQGLLATDIATFLHDSAKSDKLSCVLTHFNKLSESYIQTRMPSCLNASYNNSLENRGMSLSELTKYSKFQKLKTIKCQKIVSSIDFDKDQLFFSAAEMTQVKVHNYKSVMECSGPLHYPIQNIRCVSNISSIFYNNFLLNQLAFCCSNGSVIMSDVHTGAHVRQWKEHQSRC